MSSGAFDYNQVRIKDIITEIEHQLLIQGNEKDDVNEYWNKDFYEKYPEERFNKTYSEEVQQILRDGIAALKRAYVYAQRIDWFLSGDDGEESLKRRLKEELEKL